MENGFPIIINIRSALCAVIGGGKVATRKIAALLEASARVTVISPEVSPQIEAWEQEGKLTVKRKEYEGAGDLRGSALVFAATSKDEVNASVSKDAVILGILVNDALKPSRSTFYLPAVLRRGKLVFTVSTSGASPGLARKLRDELSEQYGDEYTEYVEFLAELRHKVIGTIGDIALREQIFQQALNFDILKIIQSGAMPTWRERLFAKLPLVNTCEDIVGLFELVEQVEQVHDKQRFGNEA